MGAYTRRDVLERLVAQAVVKMEPDPDSETGDVEPVVHITYLFSQPAQLETVVSTPYHAVSHRRVVVCRMDNPRAARATESYPPPV
jgi:hypothetical protein